MKVCRICDQGNFTNFIYWEIFIDQRVYEALHFIITFVREMKCLRHKIHLNLFLSVLTANLVWVVSYAVQVREISDLAPSQSLVLIPRQGLTWQPPTYLHPLGHLTSIPADIQML